MVVSKHIKTTTELYVIDWHSLDISEDKDASDSDSDSDSDKDKDSDKEYDPKKYLCNNKFIVRAFCLDEKGNSSTVDINDFTPYFYVKVPNNWTVNDAHIFVKGIKGKARKWYSETLVSHKLINAKPFYGFTANDKFKYIKLLFSCKTAWYHYAKLFDEKIRIFGLNCNEPYHYEPFESNLDPLLRFMHCRDIKAVGWMNIMNIEEKYSNETTCDIQYSCSSNNVYPLEKEGIPSIKYVGFDIEADSSHGDFPIAKKDYQKLARDIIIEYNNIRDLKLYDNMRPVIATFLYQAFQPYYNNYNIQCVELLEPYYPTVKEIITNSWITDDLRTVIDTCSDKLYNIIKDNEQDDAINNVLDIFETEFPAINTDKSDYFALSEQIVIEFNKQVTQNSRSISSDPIGVIINMLELAFNPYYHNLNINRIYTEYNKQPRTDLLIDMIPSINKICQQAYHVLLSLRKVRMYRKNKIKFDKTDYKLDEKVDDYVPSINEILNKYLPKPEDDAVVQIGSTFKKYGETDCYLKHIICLKGCEPIQNKTLIDFEFDGVDLPIKFIEKHIKELEKTSGNKILPPKSEQTKEFWDYWNKNIIETRKKAQYETDKSEVVVETYDTEEEVLLAWQKVISTENPDIVIGYNTFGFDYKYLYDRAEQLGVLQEFSKLGKICNTEEQLVEKKLMSAGLGDNTLYYISMQGRISIDLYKVMQSMHKLDSYKLDSVCREFMYKRKVEVSPQEIFIKQRGTNNERKEIAEYCLIDCILCVRLIDRFELILNNIGMAQVCSVPISFLFLRGQGIKLFSYVAKRCRENGHLIPVMEADEDEGKYEGATVLDPDRGIHDDDPVVVADFNSLYPSCIISENLSHNSFVGSVVVKKGESVNMKGKLLGNTKYEKSLINDEYKGWAYVDIVYDVKKDVPVAPGRKKTHKVVIGHKICRFSQPPNGKKDIIPTILEDLLASRKSTKNKRDTYEEGSFNYNLYDGLQQAYKVTANSLYGIIGARTSQIRLREIAACTTATGRKLINISSKFVRNNYKDSSITYGDTDSIFCKFKCIDRKGNKLYGLDAINKSILLCTESSYLISEQLKKPHNLEFEKAIKPFILLSKKRYHGYYFEKYGSSKYSAKSMGIVLKRRDNAPIVKHIFGGMVDIIMNENSVDKAIEFVRRECDKVLKGKFPLNKFIIAKTLRSYYKAPDSIAHNVLAQRIGKRDPGNKPRGNDRLEFAYIINKEAELQGERIETPEYIRKNKLKLDYGHYITNQIAKPIIQIFELAGKGMDVFDKLLVNYYLDQEGQKRISEYKGLFKTTSRITMGIKIAGKELDSKLDDIFDGYESDKDELLQEMLWELF
uniref:DNA-directed DNA polymerase n=1 Tax=viral metagenome TaxID=1070528 RepID=A0A6C0J8D6_9ZZZZ